MWLACIEARAKSAIGITEMPQRQNRWHLLLLDTVTYNVINDTLVSSDLEMIRVLDRNIFLSV